jgi:hypothetical protein
MTHDPKKYDIGELRYRLVFGLVPVKTSEIRWMLDELERLRDLAAQFCWEENQPPGQAERERDEALAQVERLRGWLDKITRGCLDRGILRQWPALDSVFRAALADAHRAGP